MWVFEEPLICNSLLKTYVYLSAECPILRFGSHDLYLTEVFKKGTPCCQPVGAK